MALEIEMKFRIDEPEAFRARLRSRADADGDAVLEENWILDSPNAALRAKDIGLRVRRARSTGANGPETVTLTVKGPRRRSDNAKTREEQEVTIADAPPEALLALLSLLGYRPRVIFEKRRETFRCEGCTICLDELPQLGHWLEIEGPSESAVGEMQQSLGLSDDRLEPDTYVTLAANAVNVDADSCHVLRF